MTTSPASATVLRAGGGVYDVRLADGSVAEASLRGRLKLDKRTGDSVVAGDNVTVARQGDSLTIESVEPRRSELARRAPGHARRAKVIVANVDRIVIVFAAASPEPKRGLLDRFLVLAEANDLDVLIVMNKTDIASDDVVRTFLAPYEAAGYATLRTSVKADIGLDALRESLCGVHSVIAGPSGAGKSSLLNTVQPDLGLRIGEVSSAVNKGQHTTVSAVLIPLDCGGYVADTPGLRELGLWGITAEDLPHCFPEFNDMASACRYNPCTHTHEPACAVRSAVDTGLLDAARYDSYVKLRTELADAPRY